MSTAFVAQLRTRRQAIELAPPVAGTLAIRVEASELWDAVRVIARPDTVVAEIKQRVVQQLYPSTARVDEFVLKYRGWEILDERATVQDCGLVDGSIVLLGYRRRRPVR